MRGRRSLEGELRRRRRSATDRNHRVATTSLEAYGEGNRVRAVRFSERERGEMERVKPGLARAKLGQVRLDQLSSVQISHSIFFRKIICK
jgi:hypothetical protein